MAASKHNPFLPNKLFPNFEAMVEIIVCWYLHGNRSMPGFLTGGTISGFRNHPQKRGRLRDNKNRGCKTRVRILNARNPNPQKPSFRTLSEGLHFTLDSTHRSSNLPYRAMLARLRPQKCKSHPFWAPFSQMGEKNGILSWLVEFKGEPCPKKKKKKKKKAESTGQPGFWKEVQEFSHPFARFASSHLLCPAHGNPLGRGTPFDVSPFGSACGCNWIREITTSQQSRLPRVVSNGPPRTLAAATSRQL